MCCNAERCDSLARTSIRIPRFGIGSGLSPTCRIALRTVSTAIQAQAWTSTALLPICSDDGRSLFPVDQCAAALALNESSRAAASGDRTAMIPRSFDTRERVHGLRSQLPLVHLHCLPSPLWCRVAIMASERLQREHQVGSVLWRCAYSPGSYPQIKKR